MPLAAVRSTLLLCLCSLSLTLGSAVVGCSSDGASDPSGSGGSGQAGGAGGTAFPSPEGGAGGSAGNQGGAGGSGELEVLPGMFLAEDTPLKMVSDGDLVDLTLPPQGGHVVLVAAQVRNLATDTVELRTRLRDPDTNIIVAEEGRTVVMVKVPGDPTLSQPDLRSRSQVNHVPVCPDYGDQDVVGRKLKLEVSVRELYVDISRSATGTRSVVPTCDNNANVAECVCECSAGYVLGKCGAPPKGGLGPRNTPGGAVTPSPVTNRNEPLGGRPPRPIARR